MAPGPVFFEYILANPPVSNIIFSALSPATLIRFSWTCRDARDAVRGFWQIAYDIDRHLKRFFRDPREFRELQARTGTLISGSSALQFLDRTVYPGSDLDLYVEGRYALSIEEWLVNSAGYSYRPRPSLSKISFKAVLDVLLATDPTDPRFRLGTFFGDPFDDDYSSVGGVGAVFTFVKPAISALSEELEVQLIATSLTPVETILRFHSTCVMNLISFANAYSLYPKATFEERRSLITPTAASSHMQTEGRDKYVSRGWKMTTLSRQERDDPRSSFGLGDRWLGDRLTWTLPLGAECPAIRSSEGSQLNTDNLALHNWCLRLDLSDAVMEFEILISPALKFHYVTSMPEIKRHLRTLLALADTGNASVGPAVAKTFDERANSVARKYYALEEEQQDFLHELKTVYPRVDPRKMVLRPFPTDDSDEDDFYEVA
ncbi:hypothetical protein PLICRDRAFT_120574 [Plicaturopsis crispa FD-325 SS-3]|nr:hypothetical protein PLICRDRAFT_120574 [Plicaturopsis crispa FD-325 SS-3]